MSCKVILKHHNFFFNKSEHALIPMILYIWIHLNFPISFEIDCAMEEIGTVS